MIVNWCVPVFGSVKMRFWQRMLVALAGSTTFTAVWWARVRIERAELFFDEEIFGVGFILAGFLIPIYLSFLYAFLCSWKIHNLGPIRIYALSIIFPYLVWRLLYTM